MHVINVYMPKSSENLRISMKKRKDKDVHLLSGSTL